MIVRPVSEQQLDQLVTIEQSVTEFPWPRSQFAQSLVSGHSLLGLQITEAEELIGFAVFSSVVDEASLLNIAVDSKYQGQGFGRALLLQGLESLQHEGAVRCFLEVRESNQPAIHLYRSLGFIIAGTRKNYYPAAQGREDALLMHRDIPLNNRSLV